MMRVQQVSVTVSVAVSLSVQRVLQVLRVADVLAQVVRAQEQVAAVHRQVRHHVVTVSPADVPDRMQVRMRVQGRSVAARVHLALQATAVTTVAAHALPHVPAQAPALDHPAPIAHVVQLFSPSNLSDNRLARPACKICHHEYLN